MSQPATVRNETDRILRLQGDSYLRLFKGAGNEPVAIFHDWAQPHESKSSVRRHCERVHEACIERTRLVEQIDRRCQALSGRNVVGSDSALI